jgi:hypothetical protein
VAFAVQRRRFPVGENPTRFQPEAIGAVMEVTKGLLACADEVVE